MKPTETKNLSWKDAWWYLLNGRKIKRPLWEGYWIWENNTIMMHCRDGSVTDIRETDFVAYTFSNIAQRDWMVVEEGGQVKRGMWGVMGWGCLTDQDGVQNARMDGDHHEG